MEPKAKIPSRLAKICVESILRNIGSYRTLLKTKLAPPVREMLLDELTYNTDRIKGLDDGFAFDKVWADLPFLLNSRTKEFTSRWLRYIHEYSVPCRPLQPILRQLLVHLSEQAPNLEHLDLNLCGENERILLANQEMFAIGRMEKLTTIDFHDVTITLSQIRSLTIECKNLQEITADKIETEEIPTFEEISFDNFPIQVIKVSDWQEKRIGIHLRNDSSEGAISTGFRLFNLVLGELSHLSLMEKHTNLTRFSLDCWNLEDEDLLEEFPYSLPSLELADIKYSSGNVLRKFLEKNGEKLDKLCIAGTQPMEDASMSYAQLFDLCPNLKRLKLDDWHPTGNEIRINCLEHLLHLEIRGDYDFIADRGVVFQLSCILTAPNLKFVKINLWWKFDLGDYQSFIARITRREIFKNLNFLSLEDAYYYAHYDESNDKFPVYIDETDERERLVELEDAIKLSKLQL